MNYYTISHNNVMQLPESSTLEEAQTHAAQFYRSSIYPACVVNELELIKLSQSISKILGGYIVCTPL